MLRRYQLGRVFKIQGQYLSTSALDRTSDSKQTSRDVRVPIMFKSLFAHHLICIRACFKKHTRPSGLRFTYSEAVNEASSPDLIVYEKRQVCFWHAHSSQLNGT